ncbi:NAD(P)-dependent alcohol dehydrogenase [Halalkalibacter flavus]|uniref:NAD(P)-dependent alcohol dehydrogenase n=1 Tax=Halalkalibacter flavus TaxID=3090668 RepID=UPI002FC7EC0F
MKQSIEIPEKMKAAFMTNPMEIELKEIDVPQVYGDEVLVKVMAVGICGSDVHYYENGRIGTHVVEKPMILGHECAGIVVSVGESVTTVNVGDRVAIEPGITCGRCENCKSGKYNLCPKVEFMATPPFNGSFVQYVKHREDFLFPIPDHLPFEAAALIEPFSVGIHGAKRVNLQPGSTVAIMGMGPVGLLAVVAAKIFGASNIIVTDLEEKRLEVAKELGATHAINIRKENANEVITTLTNQKGVDVAFETAGNPLALKSALKSLKKGGKLAIIGLPAKDEVELNIPFISDNEVDIYGVFRYANTYPSGIEFMASNPSIVNKLITNQYPLENTKEAMDQALYNKKESIKVFVYPNG